jgi:hypothetical protein
VRRFVANLHLEIAKFAIHRSIGTLSQEKATTSRSTENPQAPHPLATGGIFVVFLWGITSTYLPGICSLLRNAPRAVPRLPEVTYIGLLPNNTIPLDERCWIWCLKFQQQLEIEKKLKL